jgi:hypothetical protein
MGAGWCQAQLEPDDLAVRGLACTPTVGQGFHQQQAPSGRRVVGVVATNRKAITAVTNLEPDHLCTQDQAQAGRRPGVQDGVGDRFAHKQNRRLTEMLQSPCGKSGFGEAPRLGDARRPTIEVTLGHSLHGRMIRTGPFGEPSPSGATGSPVTSALRAALLLCPLAAAGGAAKR